MRPSLTKQLLPFVILAANLAVIVALWWQGSSGMLWQNNSSGERLIALGRLVGLIAELALLTQLVLIGRMRFIEKLFGFDRLNRVHRWIGYCFLFFILLHPLFLTLGYSQSTGQPLVQQFLTFINTFEDTSKALIGLIIIVGVATLSYPLIRNRLRYETWHGLHLLMYVAIGLVFGHQINTADVSQGNALYYWLALNFLVFGLLITYRFLRPFYLAWHHKFRIEKIMAETKDVWSVYISGVDMTRFHFNGGQYANIMFLARGLWYPHPFSFSQAYNGTHVRFTMRASGDFTKRIGELKIGTRVILDGPLGVFTAERAVQQKLLLIAGGIGITPLRAMAEAKYNRDIVLLYGNRTTQNVPFRTELELLNIKTYFVFSDDTAPNSERGRIDGVRIQRLVPDWREREVFICGPGLMMQNISNELKQLGMSKKQIHFENFYH